MTYFKNIHPLELTKEDEQFFKELLVVISNYRARDKVPQSKSIGKPKGIFMIIFDDTGGGNIMARGRINALLAVDVSLDILKRQLGCTRKTT